ncbi:Uncharacterised protein [Klebsiella pneumoniae]|nr:Uncharacterised protein [Klebsiella pneumoniae]
MMSLSKLYYFLLGIIFEAYLLIKETRSINILNLISAT